MVIHLETFAFVKNWTFRIHGYPLTSVKLIPSESEQFYCHIYVKHYKGFSKPFIPLNETIVAVYIQILHKNILVADLVCDYNNVITLYKSAGYN